MDYNTNKTDKNEKTRTQSSKLSFNEKLNSMKIAFSNAKLPNILPILQGVGYTEEKLNEYLAKVANLEALNQTQKKEYAEKYSKTKEADKKRKQINDNYMRHLSLCRILFKNDIMASNSLEFAGERKTTYSDWYHQVSNFYAQLLSNQDLLTKINSININENELRDIQNELVELTNIKESQRKLTASSQKATENRDKALEEIYSVYLDMIAYAKVLLQNSQFLEAMGIKMKR